MWASVRANLLLLGLTLGMCSVLYPLAVLAVGQGVFPTSASGSLLSGPDGKPVGSRLVAQEFKGDEWFRPRPSAAGYDASASGGSNLGANNPKLRSRVARQLGAMARYRDGDSSSTVQQDVEAWVATRKPPVVEGNEAGSAIREAYFEMWLRENPEKAKEIEPVPADAVTTSGSGLDPHITLRNAREQLDRVVATWTAKTRRADVRAAVEEVLRAGAFEPLAGAAGGEPLVNVLEVNLELARRFAPR